MSGHFSQIGAAVRLPTGIVLPAKYSSRVVDDAANDAEVVARAARGAAPPPWRNCSGGVGSGSAQRPRRDARASVSACAYAGVESYLL